LYNGIYYNDFNSHGNYSSLSRDISEMIMAAKCSYFPTYIYFSEDI